MYFRKLVKKVSQLLVPVFLFSTASAPVLADQTSSGTSVVVPQASNSSTATAATPSASSGTTVAAQPTNTVSAPAAASTTVGSSQPGQTPPSTSDTGSVNMPSTNTANAPLSSGATNSSSAPKTISNVDASFPTNSTTSKAPKELVQDRTEYSNRYQNSDGTFSIKTYMQPINYQDPATGKWLPIDSTMISHTDGTFHNAANSFDISLPSVIKNGLISIAKDGGKVSFQPTFAGAIQGAVNKKEMKFSNVTTDTDLTYTVQSNGLKESIILNSVKAPTTFGFQMKLEGLTYKIQSDGSVDFYRTGSSKPLFYMPKPFMTDAKGQTSSDISYQFQKDASGNTIVNVVADPTWIQAADRAFPIVVDPTVQYYNTGMGNTFISSTQSGTNYSNNQDLYVGGQGTTLGTTRALFWTYLPDIPTGAAITSATLNLDNTSVYSTTQQPVIEVHRITSDWSLSGTNAVTWNNKPSITSTADETYTASNQSGPYAWDVPITSIVKGWYNGLYPNQGMELKYTDETQVLREILATADTSDPYPDDHPCITINYTIDGMGSEPFWTSDGPVNMTNMNLVLPMTDIDFPGRHVAVPLSRTYNSRLKTQGVFGYGWSSPLDIRLYALSGQNARLLGSNGTTYYFNRNSSGSYDSPSGMFWKLNLASSTTATITTVDNIVYTFTNVPNTTGVYELTQVNSANINNTLTYSYNSSNQVTSISDGAGHSISLSYSNGLVSTATDPSGKTWSYDYDSNNNLITVNQPDGYSEQYRYDSNHNLTATVSPSGKITYYDYQPDASDATSFRVLGINPTNMVMNGNFEVDSDGNNIPDHFSYYSGYDPASTSDTTDWAPFGKTSFHIHKSSSDSANYTVFLSDPISVNPNTAYTLSGYMRGSQTTGALTTVLSMYAYDANGNNLGEVGRTAINGTFDFTRYSVPLNPANGTGLPGGTVTVRIRVADSDSDPQATNQAGTGDSWWDGIQLEEGLTATPFVSGTQYTYYPPNSRTAAYDGDGNKKLYIYDNQDQNLTEFHQQDRTGGTLLDLKSLFTWSKDKIQQYTDPNGKVWSQTYDINQQNPADNTGKLLQTLSPSLDNYTESFAYNPGTNTLKQHTMLNGRIENFTYDSNQNLLTSRNPYNTSVGTSYDAYSNSIATSNPIGSTDNLIDNSSFEEGTSDGSTPVHFVYNVGQYGWWRLDTNNVVSGQNSFTIAAQGGTSQTDYSVLLSDPVTIDPTIGYLLSGYLMATQSNGSQKTILSVYAYDSNGNYLNEVGRMELDGASGWQRWRTIILPKDLLKGTAQFRVKVAGENDSGYGNSYFDNIQLQPNIVDTAYNLIDNASFERGASGATWPSDWTNSASGTDTWETSTSYTGGKSVSIANATATTGFGSTNYWPYDSSKTYTLTAFAKTNGLTTNVGQIKIDEYDSNKNLIGGATSSFVGGTTDWTLLTSTLPKASAAAGTVYIRPVLASGNATGTIYFDNVRLTEGVGVTSNDQYDSTNSWVTTETDPLGNPTTYQYDTSGNVLQTTDPLGYTTASTYDPMNRVKTVTPPGNDVMVNYSYDKDSNVQGITMTDPTQATTYQSIGMTYTSTGQVGTYTDPFGQATSYSYTPGGLLQQVNMPTDVNMPSDSVSFGYDAANRLTDITYSGGSSPRYVIGYDNNSNVTSIADQTYGTTATASYDNENRLKSWSDGICTISYTLDSSGNITQKALKLNSATANSETESATYNQVNLPISLTDASGAENRFLYNDQGLLSMLKAGNGSVEMVDYDNDGRITKVINQTNLGTIINSYQFVYDADGQIKSITDANGTTLNYTYTAKGQLKTETLSNGDTVTYTYDALGNRLSKQETKPDGTVVSTVNYSYNKGNELAQAGTTTYSYYANGSERSNGSETFKWNAGGDLTEVDNSSGTAIAYNRYDSMGRLVQQTANGTVTNYLYDGASNHVLEEYDQSGNQMKYYTWGPNGLLAITINGKTYYTVHNAHGDIVALTDASGNVLVTYTYDTWGNLVSDTDNSGIGLAALNPYRYAGYRFDDATGMYYLMARWYDPSIGRFLSQDPNNITPDYAYGGNNPLTYIDPNGRNLTWSDVWSGSKSIGSDALTLGSKIAGGFVGGFAGVVDNFMNPTVLGPAQTTYPTYDGPAVPSPVYGPPMPSASDNYVQSSDDSGISDSSSVGEGVVYKRTNAKDDNDNYIGQAKSEERYLARQKEHARNNPDAVYDFEVLGRAAPGRDSLDVLEQEMINRHGGVDKLSNKRNQIRPSLWDGYNISPP